MPTANAPGEIKSEGSVGKVSARRVFRYVSDWHGCSAFPDGMLRDIAKVALEGVDDAVDRHFGPPDVEDLVAEITPRGRATVPDAVKAELLQKIRDFLKLTS